MKKVGIVQAFAHDPDVLLLDEPSTRLDPLVQRELLRPVIDTNPLGAGLHWQAWALPLATATVLIGLAALAVAHRDLH
jgi:ABC-type uncharacterized transport system ATPase subunit